MCSQLFWPYSSHVAPLPSFGRPQVRTLRLKSFSGTVMEHRKYTVTSRMDPTFSWETAGLLERAPRSPPALRRFLLSSDTIMNRTLPPPVFTRHTFDPSPVSGWIRNLKSRDQPTSPSVSVWMFPITNFMWTTYCHSNTTGDIIPNGRNIPDGCSRWIEHPRQISQMHARSRWVVRMELFQMYIPNRCSR